MDVVRDVGICMVQDEGCSTQVNGICMVMEMKGAARR